MTRRLLICFSIILLVPFVFVALCFFVPFPQWAQFDQSESIRFFVYPKGSGKPSHSMEFPPKSELHEKLNSWLKDNWFGWRHSLITYGGEIMMYSNGANLFLNDGFVVLNYDDGCFFTPGYTQVVQRINAKQLIAELIELESSTNDNPKKNNNLH